MKIEIANIEDVPEILSLQYLTETVASTLKTESRDFLWKR